MTQLINIESLSSCITVESWCGTVTQLACVCLCSEASQSHRKYGCSKNLLRERPTHANRHAQAYTLLHDGNKSILITQFVMNNVSRQLKGWFPCFCLWFGVSLYILACCQDTVVQGLFYYLPGKKSPFVAIHFCTVWNCAFHRLENCPSHIIHHGEAVVCVWFCHKICFAFNSLCPSWIGMSNALCSAYSLNHLKCTERNENLKTN